MNIESTDIASVEESSSDVLFYLTDWITKTSEAPRSKGETIQIRFSVVAIAHCWVIVEQKQSGSYQNQIFASSLSDLCPYFRIVANITLCDGVRLCVAALEEITGRKCPQRMDDAMNVDSCLNYMRMIDDFYSTDYALYADVREKIFNTRAV